MQTFFEMRLDFPPLPYRYFLLVEAGSLEFREHDSAVSRAHTCSEPEGQLAVSSVHKCNNVCVSV